MSEFTDNLINRMFFDGDRKSFKEKKRTFQAGSGNYKWRKSDGTVVNMKDMTTAHLKNAIDICKKKANSGKLEQLEEVLARKIEDDEI